MRVSTAPRPDAAPSPRVLRHPRHREIVLVGILLVAVATGFRIWALRGVWFFFDDVYFMQRSMRSELSLAYLVPPYNGHLMPGAMLLNWVNTRIAPLDFTAPAIEIIVDFPRFRLAT